MVATAPNATGEDFLLYKNLFRSSPTEDKEIKAERKQKVINLNGVNYDYEETQIEIDKSQSVRYIQQISNVVEFINNNAPSDLVNQAKPYLDELNMRLTPFEILGLPSFGASLPEDETLLIEWDLEHFTIGLSFEPNSEDSSWYIVNDGRIRGTTSWGYLDSKPINELVQQFVDEALGSLNGTE